MDNNLAYRIVSNLSTIRCHKDNEPVVPFAKVYSPAGIAKEYIGFTAISEVLKNVNPDDYQHGAKMVDIQFGVFTIYVLCKPEQDCFARIRVGEDVDYVNSYRTVGEVYKAIDMGVHVIAGQL